MGISIKHAAHSDAPDVGAPAGAVKGSDWNADHGVTLTGLFLAMAELAATPNSVPYVDGAGTGKLTTLTDYSRSLLAAASASAVLSLLGAAPTQSPAFTGTPTAPTAPNGTNTSQVATCGFVRGEINTLAALVSGALVFKGAWSAAGGTFPGGGAALTGWFYMVSTAGTVGGVSFSVGDCLYAIKDNASSTTYAGNWLKVEGVLTSAEIVTALGFTPENAAKKGVPNGYAGLDGAGTLNIKPGGNAIVIKSSSGTTASAILRKDTVNFYVLLTADGDPDGSFDGRRPFVIPLAGAELVTDRSWSIAADGYYAINTRAKIIAPSDGVITLQNNAQSGFTSLNFGGNTSAFPALGRSGTTLVAYLADLSGTASFVASQIRAASGYYNFGPTLGGTGYGIRDNSGTIEAKDSGGTWSPVLTALDIGTDAGDVVVVQPGGKLPALDASNLYNVPAAEPTVGAMVLAHKNGTNQTLNNGDVVGVTFGTAAINEGNRWDTSNSRFTPGDGERWLLGGYATLLSVSDGSYVSITLRKNGTIYLVGPQQNNGAVGQVRVALPVVSVVGNGSDYYELYLSYGNSTGSTTISGAATDTYFTATRLR